MSEPTAPVFDIQRFSLHDGPGVRSLVFLKGCTLHCPWCQNPESQSTKPVVAFYEDRCRSSFECLTVCPNDAIRVEGFRVDHARCNLCTRCIDACAYEALRLIGEDMTPDRLMERLEADRPYYDSSGGGVTFTGGEPTIHHRFLEVVLARCNETGIRTNLETSGTFSWERWRETLRRLDLIYFDLKLLDPDLHERHLGGGYERIMENAANLVAGGYPVEFRMALIPDFTDTPDNIDAAVDLLHALGRPSIHLLPYHNMGDAKIDIIQGNQPRLGLARYSDERFAEMRRVFETAGIEVLTA